ncbi:hypothetical protein QE418_001772 [Microbacterium testaceum]|nr:hypothetical protein [Microbacterium testaceum]
MGVLREVELQHARHRTGEELAVVAHEHDAAAEPAHERLETLQPVEVQVVGRLIEQGDVETRQQQSCQTHARGLASGQTRHLGIRTDFQPQVGEHHRHPLVEVGGAAREPSFEGCRVGIVGSDSRRIAERWRRGIHLAGRLGGARPSGDVLRDRLPGHALVFLRQPADERVGGSEADRSRLRLVDAGEQAQQSRLTGPVRPDYTDDVSRCDRQVDARRRACGVRGPRRGPVRRGWRSSL